MNLRCRGGVISSTFLVALAVSSVGSLTSASALGSGVIYHQHYDVGSPFKERIKGWPCWLISGFLVLFSGVASGLTVGLLSLDPVRLKVLQEEETSDQQKRRLSRVIRVVEKHHLLLVTLLLANALAMEALPIFLDILLPSWAAVLLSVTAILLFGEVIPQALCTGHYQMAIAEYSAPFVHLLIATFFVVTWPISRLLDCMFGQEHTEYYARAHLKALIRMHERDRRVKAALSKGDVSDASSALGRDEVVVIEGALDMAHKNLGEIMLPIERVFMLEAQTPLNRDTFKTILESGHSRVPVYSKDRNNLIGLLLTKYLLSIDPNPGKVRAADLIVPRRPIFAAPTTNLYDLLNEFQKGHSHIAFVTESVDDYVAAFKSRRGELPPTATLLGIATLEDVIEELIQEEIYDEFDASAKLHTSLSLVTGDHGSFSVGSKRVIRTPVTGNAGGPLPCPSNGGGVCPPVPSPACTNLAPPSGIDDRPPLPNSEARTSSWAPTRSDSTVKKYGGTFPASITVPLVDLGSLPTPREEAQQSNTHRGSRRSSLKAQFVGMRPRERGSSVPKVTAPS